MLEISCIAIDVDDEWPLILAGFLSEPYEAICAGIMAMVKAASGGASS